ncbi:Kinesin-like protein KIF16B [Amphibalanus amphitrite]|uniref:Kinesin-like protein KIF16B n=1 Tax=Amphibalanus amphitrite TaxID=1232801 RepID=A0A6A4X721_AMPAM|nr:Kinesin-like protein KIF16B [Amphibalanus amphitrite]
MSQVHGISPLSLLTPCCDEALPSRTRLACDRRTSAADATDGTRLWPAAARGSDSPPPASVVTVPRYVLRGAGRDAHFEYEIRLCAGGERYTLYRRFQRFRELHRYVAQRYGEQATAAVRLPPAKLFGRTSETLANERRGQLEEYLRRLLEKCSGLAGCPLHLGVTRRTLADFAPFFQRGVFEFTRAMTS